MKPTRMKKPAPKPTPEGDLIKKHMDKIKAEFPPPLNKKLI
jgi:hypothetical protein